MTQFFISTFNQHSIKLHFYQQFICFGSLTNRRTKSSASWLSFKLKKPNKNCHITLRYNGKPYLAFLFLKFKSTCYPTSIEPTNIYDMLYNPIFFTSMKKIKRQFLRHNLHSEEGIKKFHAGVRVPLCLQSGTHVWKDWF